VTPKSVAEYDEMLHVPLRWWVQATMFLATLWLAFIVSIPTAAIAWSATAVLTAAVAALFLGYGSARVRLRDGELQAGTARIPVALLDEPTALDADETRRLIGVHADARAYLVLRPYVKRAVKVTVTDPADPVPYWLVSSRRPDQLVAALSEAMDGSHSG
jgi:hypothetical protein